MFMTETLPHSLQIYRAAMPSLMRIGHDVSGVISQMAKALTKQAKPPPNAEVQDMMAGRMKAIVDAFVEISSAVRVTVMLSRRLDLDIAGHKRPERRHVTGMRPIKHVVTDADDDDEAALHAEEAIAHGPVKDVVGLICKSFGIDPEAFMANPSSPDLARKAEDYWVARIPGGRDCQAGLPQG